MFRKKKMSSIIRASGTIFYSLVYVNSRIGFNALKYIRTNPHTQQPTSNSSSHPTRCNIIRKRALYLRKRALYLRKRALYLRKRALNLRKRALYLCKRALYLRKRALNLRKRAPYLRKRALQRALYLKSHPPTQPPTHLL